MAQSVDRILTTHVGSLPRPKNLRELIVAKEQSAPFDNQELSRQVKEAVADIVSKQIEVGIDIVNDGELGRYGFITYINDRLAGFRPGIAEDGRNYWGKSREGRAFPEFYEWVSSQQDSAASVSITKWICDSAIHYNGQSAVAADVLNLKNALNGYSPADAFISAISPANVETWQYNQYYTNQDDYLSAIADALREEYQAIVKAGYTLQIDDPALASYYLYNPAATLPEFRRWAEKRVEILNYALAGIPEEKVRYHTCYGINIGPRTTDLELKSFVDILLKIHARTYSFEAANPRHEHEWQVWLEARIPDDKVLMPGVVTQSSVLVEHPELVAERIIRFAKIVGRENVIASTDCGFASFATSNEIHDSIVWAKLGALVRGAEIASTRLW